MLLLCCALLLCALVVWAAATAAAADQNKSSAGLGASCPFTKANATGCTRQSVVSATCETTKPDVSSFHFISHNASAALNACQIPLK